MERSAYLPWTSSLLCKMIAVKSFLIVKRICGNQCSIGIHLWQRCSLPFLSSSLLIFLCVTIAVSSCLCCPLFSPPSLCISLLLSGLPVHLSLPLPPLTLCLSILLLTFSTFCSTLPSSLFHLLILYSSTWPSNLLASSSAEFPFPILSYGLSFSPFSSAIHYFINAVKAWF